VDGVRRSGSLRWRYWPPSSRSASDFQYPRPNDKTVAVAPVRAASVAAENAFFHHVAAAMLQKIVAIAAPSAAKLTFGETWRAAVTRETVAVGAGETAVAAAGVMAVAGFGFGLVILKSFGQFLCGCSDARR
jgi:hypothetical protein